MSEPQRTPSGPLQGLLAGLAMGLVAALVVGFADALHARQLLAALPERARTANTPLGWSAFSACLGGAILLYALWLVPLAAGIGGLLGLRWSRERAAFGAGTLVLGAALSALIFWWTRESWYPGLPVTDPRRLTLLAGIGAGGLLLGGFLSLAVLPARRPLALLCALTVVLGAGLLYFEGQKLASRGALNERNRALPNVLFVVVDALRADKLGCYGNALGASPNIDRLADGGVLFEDAYAQAPYTWTSFGSFFTGKYPRRHGLMKMAPGVALEKSLTMQELWKVGQLPDGTSLESMDCMGAAFMTGALSHGSGFSQGFDSYVELMMGHPRVDLDSGWSILRARLTLPSLLFKLEAKRDPDLLVDTARSFLEEQRANRWWAFVHLYSTHTPYDPPEPFRSRFVDPAYRGPIQRFDAESRRAIEQQLYEVTPEDVRRIEDLYLGGVAQADHHIGLLLDDLERLGISDDTIVIVTADHGEDLGEGGRWEHNHMYRSNLHIPLVIRWPKGQAALGIQPGTRVGSAVESIDLLPTLAEWSGIAIPSPAGPRDLIDGVSLVDWMAGRGQPPHPYTFAEDSTYVAVSDGRYMLVLDRYAVAEDGWELALEEGLGVVRLEDLESDPNQRRNLFFDAYRAKDPDPLFQQKVAKIVERLRAALLAYDAQMPIGAEEVVKSERDLETEANQQRQGGDDAAQRRTLIKLGYLEEGDRTSYVGDLRARVLELRHQEQPQAAQPASKQ